MSWASEQSIVEHNARMESDDDYAEEVYRQEAEQMAWFEWREDIIEKETNWFSDSRLDYTGYEEIEITESNIPDFNFEDIPF